MQKISLKDLGITEANWLVVECYDNRLSCYWIIKDGVVQDRVNTWAQAKKYMEQHKIKTWQYREQYTGQTRLLGLGGEAI